VGERQNGVHPIQNIFLSNRYSLTSVRDFSKKFLKKIRKFFTEKFFKRSRLLSHLLREPQDPKTPRTPAIPKPPFFPDPVL
jgi:hypothetical protein